MAVGLLLARLILLCALALSGTAFAQDAQWAPGDAGSEIDVALVTVGPGQIYWERFGHNAILIRERGTGDAALYNYGIFDFNAESFLLNFLRGRMTYIAAVAPPARDVAFYLRQGRSVDVQWLNLAPNARLALHEFLAWNVRPENAPYRYDYFVDNCSTKVRDALDRASGGAIARALVGRSRGLSFRMHAQRLTAPDFWLYQGIHAGLSGYADRPVSFWQEGFVPMELQRRLREVRIDDAQGTRVPLVAREERLAEPRYAPPDAESPTWRWLYLACGVALALAMLALAAARAHAFARGTFAALAVLFWLVMGLGGCVLAGLWALSEHQSAWANENLFLFDPLCLLLIPAAIGAWRSTWAPSSLVRWLVIAFAVLAAFALFAKALPGFRQDNLDWIALLLPPHLAMAFVLTRSRPANSDCGGHRRGGIMEKGSE